MTIADKTADFVVFAPHTVDAGEKEFYGTNYLIPEIAQGGMKHEHVMPSLERFAKYVMPVFQDEE